MSASRVLATVAAATILTPAVAYAPPTPGTFPLELPPAQINEPYSFTIAEPDIVEYELGRRPLPPGLTLQTDGVISGTPTEGGVFAFELTLTGPNGVSEVSFRLSVRPRILTDLPPAIAGQRYETTLIAEGAAPFTWSRRFSPPWLALSQSGLLSGVPAFPGEFRFGVDIFDAFNTRESVVLTLIVSESVTIELPDNLRRPVVGEDYCSGIDDVRLEATGGIPPYTWLEHPMNSGDLWVREDGVVCGSPQQPGQVELWARVRDSSGGEDDLRVVLVAVAPEVALAIITETLPPAQVGLPYQAPLEAVSSAPPVQWRIVEGELPTGLTFIDDAIVGTPTQTGTYDISVEAQDQASVAIQALSLVVTRGDSDGTLAEGAPVGCRCTGRDAPASAWIAGVLLLLVFRRRSIRPE